MSVTTAIENISNHLKNAYNELEGLGADLSNVNKNIENISVVLDDIYDSMPQASGEGTSLTLDNTRVGKIKSTLKGNTSQTGTPTPEAPVEVETTTGDNTINICGKNLFDESVATNNCRVSEGIITITSNTTDVYIQGAYVYSEKNKFLTVPAGSYYLKSTNPNVRVTFYGTHTIDTENNQPVTFNSTADFGGIRIRSSSSLQNVSFGIMLSTNDTTYEPYQGQTYKINLGDIELCKIGDYQDKIYKDNNKWYIKRQIEKRALDGSEDWVYQSEYQRFGYYFGDNWNTGGENHRYEILSNYFRYASSGNADGIGFIFIRQIYLYNYDYTSSTDFKTWLSNNNVLIYYVLATPTITEITDTTLINQLEALKKAISYDEQTNINQTNNILPFIIEASALKKND